MNVNGKFGAVAFTLFIVFSSSDAFSKSTDADAFHICMARTKHDRLNCNADCGMILQRCYDERISDLNQKVDGLRSALKARHSEACANLAATYLSEASRMEDVALKNANNMIGWVAAELSLSFARQKLKNLEIIQDTCKQ
jgi:hypothetical protein